MKPIRIHYADDDAQARTRHEEIIGRLEFFGPEQVRTMMGQGFPSQWDPIIVAWLNGDKLEAEKAETAEVSPDWPPRGPAIYLRDGEQRQGSTGQRFEVKNGQWVRIIEPEKPSAAAEAVPEAVEAVQAGPEAAPMLFSPEPEPQPEAAPEPPEPA